MTVQQEIQALVNRLSYTIDEQAQADIIVTILGKYAKIQSLKGWAYIDRLMQLADTLDSDRYRAHAIYHSSLAARFRGEYMKSLELCGQAQAIFASVGDQVGVGRCYNNKGNIHEALGNYPESLKNHLASLKIWEETNDKEGIAISYSNIGIISENQGKYEDALENHYRGLKIMKELGNKAGLANAYINIGNIYYAQKRHEEAMEHYLLCQEIHRESGNENGIASVQSNIASIYHNMGNYEEALKNHLAARQRFEQLGNKYNNAQGQNNIAKSYLAQGDHKQALAYYQGALEIAEEIGSKDEARVASDGLYQTYKAMGHHDDALRYFEKYHALDKEMVGEQALQQMTQLSFQHNMELKEKEAALLKEKNEAINVYAQKLEVSNNELKQFANIASHDLREPLRMVTSYMQLLEQTMGEEIKPVQKQFIGFAVDGAKRMEQLIHDLLHLSKVDADPRIERVPLPSVIQEVRSNLEVLLREKNARIEADPLPAIMADRTQILQLFQNVIGNGIKYNESPEPLITISYRQGPTDALLSIADNGIGIPAEYRERAFQIFQRLPTAKQYQGTGIGLAICKKIVDGLGGTITISDREGGGTVFVISLPLTMVTVG